MQKQLRWRVLAVAGMVAVAVGVLWPPADTIRLGLDLRGGVHLVLRVQTDEGLQIEAETDARRLSELAGLDGIARGSVRAVSPTEILVAGAPADRDAEVRRLADDQLAGYDRISAADGVHRYRLRPDVEQARRDRTVRQARLTIARRIEAFGVTEPVIARHGAAPAGDGPDVHYLVRRSAPISGRDLRHARPTVDEFNRPAIGFSLNRGGARSFAALTGTNVGRDLAIILDGRVQSVAVIEEPITGGEGRIHGAFTPPDRSIDFRYGKG